MAVDSRITAVEINPIITGDVMTKLYLDYSGAIYHDPSVELVWSRPMRAVTWNAATKPSM